MAPVGIDSTEMFETDLWCEDCQYGGLVTGEVIGESIPTCGLWGGGVCVSRPSLGAPGGVLLLLPLLACALGIDSIHLQMAAINRSGRS